MIEYIHVFQIRREIHSSDSMFNWFGFTNLHLQCNASNLNAHGSSFSFSKCPNFINFFLGCQFSNHFLLKQLTKVQRLTHILLHPGSLCASGGESSPVKVTFCSHSNIQLHTVSQTKTFGGNLWNPNQVE